MDGTTGPPELGAFTDTTLSEALCGNYGGYIGGRIDGNGSPVIKPSSWLNSGSLAQLDHNNEPGRFWDVNQDNYYCGYYDASGTKQAYWWEFNLGLNSLSVGSYDGAEARGINKDRDICGQLFGATTSPPCVWKWNGSAYDLLDLTNNAVCPNWPDERPGYLVGITDRKAGDTAGPYAVGYMGPTHSSGGEAFIFSVGSGDLRRLGP